MNWKRVLLAALLGGIAHNLVSFVLHGLIMANTYASLDTVFSQEQASPAWFALISLVVAFFLTVLFQKTRQMWADGPRGGVVFALWVALIVGFNQFFLALVIDGMPYYLVWCWLGMDVISLCSAGAVIGWMIRRE